MTIGIPAATVNQPASAGRGEALTITGLSHRYGGVEALQDVSFALPAGMVLCVLGPNGAGKSTLGNCIAGNILTGPGTVLLGTADVSRVPAHLRARRGIAYLPEGGDTFPTLSVADNLMVGVGTARRRVRKERLEQAAALFPFIGQRAGTQAGMLSGGEQQMLSLARILIEEPRLVVIDELSHGLAPAIVENLFATLAAQKGSTTFVLIEQYLHRAFEVADDLLVLSRGQVRYCGAAGATTHDQIEALYLTDEDTRGAQPARPARPALARIKESEHMTVDPRRWAARIRADAVGQAPAHQAMLTTWASFLDAKYEGDVDQMRALLAPDASIRSWGADRLVPPAGDLRGADAIVAAWEDLMSDGAAPPEELEIDRLLVSDDGIAMDGTYRGVLPARAVPALAPAGADQVLVTVRAAVLVRGSGELIDGYDVYWDLHYQVSDAPAAAGLRVKEAHA
jgi:ABC-type branched-subunit amino acid transport system ATPase component